ncbi:MAG: MobF family relaxase [Vicinamibacteraceae bacterium]
MLTISTPLSPGQARRYHVEEFRSARDNYYTAGDQIIGQWHGQLAERWGLCGDVRDEHFERLADGQHPLTGAQLVRHQTPHRTMNARGETVTTMEHRGGWDATFSAPKSVSLTALVGGDERVRAVHRESVAVALHELEQYVQARLGGNRRPETTGRWIAATFEHDSARPVNGYGAPQLHTHAVVFNLTETASGDTRPLQPRELYRTQQYATAVYRSELAHGLTALGYEIERGRNGQPEIRGYTRAYLEASSPRRQQIEDHLARVEQRGVGAAQIAAHQTREPKLDLSHEEMQQRHQAMARDFGEQPTRVVTTAHERAQAHDVDQGRTTVRVAVTFAKERNLEREAVVDERALLRDALTHTLGERRLPEIRAEFETRIQAGEFIRAEESSGPSRHFTTREMQDLERDTIERMRAGQRQHRAIASHETIRDVERDHDRLSEHQRAAMREMLTSRDQTLALEGVAGAGKTTTLAAVRDAAEREGYRVEGLAPTSRAAHQLEEAGIPSRTLQRHLVERGAAPDAQPRLYVVDESSLASTKQMHAFMERLDARDRVGLVGDVRQHQGVEAGRPYEQLQDAGIRTVRLDTIVRQRDPALRTVVEYLSRGQVHNAVERLDRQGRVHEIENREDRVQQIASDYMQSPARTLVVSPDNESRCDLNQAIHRAMQQGGRVEAREHDMRVMVPRQDITGADRRWAERYEAGDVVRYSVGSRTLGLQSGEYARVEHVNARENTLTVARENGERVSYDARRLQGVTIYREETRSLAVGDRVQFTAPDRAQRVANRDLGKVERIDQDGRLHLRLDTGRSVTVGDHGRTHLDHGYAVTSHSSQGQTADRVLVHVDTARSSEQLVNRRFAYVAVSRGRHDAQIYTNDRSRLADALNRDVSHRSALTSGHAQERPGPSLERSPARSEPSVPIRGTPTHEISFSR